jgi:CheY-like chemotaxis protein
MSDQPTQVLVVDDDLATRLLAVEALLTAGFAPIEAADGHEALARYDHGAPPAILLDVNMPGLDGYEVCRRVRQRSGGAATSIMVMTASDDVAAVQLAFAAGATDFLTKPLNLPLVAHRVRYMLRAAAAASAAREAATRLARAQRLARLVHWQLDADDRFAWASDPLAVFWPDSPPGTPRQADLLTLVHPDDRARVAAALAARAGHRLDFRLVLPDGSERIVHQDAELDASDRGPILIGATQDVTELKRAEHQIAQLAFYDDLTGIPNLQFVERYLRIAPPSAGRGAIAIDLGTGQLDRLPRAARDAVIRAATARVIERVRGADLAIRLDQVPCAIEAYAGATLVARTDPDELFVVTRELGAGTAATLARQLAEALAAPVAVAGRDVVLHPRFGAVDSPDPVDDLRQLYDHARTAMLDAERSPPRDVVAFTAGARDQRVRRGELARQLHDALTAAAHAPHPDLAVVYGPRVEPRTRFLVGVRAHPRWLPAVADPRGLARILAEDPMLRDRLALWAIEQACRDAAGWLADGVGVRVAVELPYAMVAAPGFSAVFRRIVGDPGLDPGVLDLELTELPSTLDDLDLVAIALRGVRGLGAQITLARLDDTCAIGMLCRLPIDTLRLDRSTIERLGPPFIGSVAALARAWKLRIAVADLDSPAALAALDAHEPDELAGAMFGAAIPAARVPDLTAESIAERSRQPTRDIGAAARTA